MEYIVIGLCVVIVIILFIYFNIKNNSEMLVLHNEKINESLKSIDLYLEKKEEYLERALDTIKNSNKKKYSKKNIMESLIINKNKKLDRVEMYNELDKNLNELYEIVEDDAKLKEVKKLNTVLYDLNNNDSDLMASINFYNEAVNDIKKIKKNVFTNLVIKSKDYKNFEPIFINKNEDLAILKEDNK